MDYRAEAPEEIRNYLNYMNPRAVGANLRRVLSGSADIFSVFAAKTGLSARRAF